MKNKYPRKHSEEFDYFLQANLRKYRGEYVAIVGKRVAAHGSNAKEVWEKARKKYPHSLPTLAKLPKEEILVLL